MTSNHHPPPSINHQSTQYSHYLSPYRYSTSLQREKRDSGGSDPVSATRDATGKEVINILVTVDTAAAQLPLSHDHNGTNSGSSHAPPPPSARDVLGSPAAIALHSSSSTGGDIGGWVPPEVLDSGTIFSVCSLGNMMTSVRECQGLASMRDVHPALQAVVLGGGRRDKKQEGDDGGIPRGGSNFNPGGGDDEGATIMAPPTVPPAHDHGQTRHHCWHGPRASAAQGVPAAVQLDRWV